MTSNKNKAVQPRGASGMRDKPVVRRIGALLVYAGTPAPNAKFRPNRFRVRQNVPDKQNLCRLFVQIAKSC